MFDEQVVRLDKQIAAVADKFVRVRLLRITGMDLNLFEFDYDLTWMSFFLNAEEKILGRYGGRDARGPDERNSLAGLRYALERALATHQQAPTAKPPARPAKPRLVEEYPRARKLRQGQCIHCHEVNEFHRDDRQTRGVWQREERWVYPLPENVGLTMHRDRGDEVSKVAADSPAARVGLQPGDLLQTVNGVPIASFGDLQYALHRAPAEGTIPLTWKHAGKVQSARLAVHQGWRWTNLTWRPSMLAQLPSLGLSGEDLTAAEKKTLGLAANRLAFRQDDEVHSSLRKAGLRAGDVIVGLDDRPLSGTMEQFLAQVRQNYLVGDRVTLNVLRQGKAMALPLVLK